MTFEEYRNALKAAHEANRHWRLGQAAFNVLYTQRPDLAEQIRGGSLDPFHSVDRLPSFYAWAEEHWNESQIESTDETEMSKTLDERFESMLKQEDRPVDGRYRDGPHYQQRRRDFLAGAAAERRAVLYSLAKRHVLNPHLIIPGCTCVTSFGTREATPAEYREKRRERLRARREELLSELQIVEEELG